MLIRNVMTHQPVCCRPTDHIETVARLMLDHDCGEIPVCDGTKLLGVITDRDITTRVVAHGLMPSSVTAREVMTRNVVTVREDLKIDAALEVMQRQLVRRLPVVGESGEIVGIVSQADLIAKTPVLKVAKALRNVAQKSRRGAPVAV
jgi:CBS domain-containing protein